MKTTININNRAVEIELTAEQVAAIKKAASHYTDIKTFEDACLFEGIDHDDWMEENEHLPSDVMAYMQLRIIAKALNGGEVLDYTDTKIYKYYPWFNAVGSASGFSFIGCRYDGSFSVVGSRLVYKKSEIAKYAGTQFIEIYNKYINAK